MPPQTEFRLQNRVPGHDDQVNNLATLLLISINFKIMSKYIDNFWLSLPLPGNPFSVSNFMNLVQKAATRTVVVRKRSATLFQLEM